MAKKTIPKSKLSADRRALEDVVRVLTRIADALEAVVDVEKRTLRMVDVERASVYKTHLGAKLSDGKAP